MTPSSQSQILIWKTNTFFFEFLLFLLYQNLGPFHFSFLVVVSNRFRNSWLCHSHSNNFVIRWLLSIPGAHLLHPSCRASFRDSSKALNLSINTSWTVWLEQNWLISWLYRFKDTVFCWRSRFDHRSQYSFWWFNERGLCVDGSPPQPSGSLG